MFSIPGGQRLFEFRRGTTAALIQSMSFSAASDLLSVSSDSDTVHVFKLDEPKPRTPSLVNLYLSETFSSFYDQPVRDFARVKLPLSGRKNLCVLSSNTHSPFLLCGVDEFYYQFSLNKYLGGDGRLLERHR